MNKNEAWFPKVWKRYVDDVFAIKKLDQLEMIKDNLNNKFESIKTHKIEKDGKLPFLDRLMKR